MPNHKSCAKRVKTSLQERIRNRSLRSNLRNAVKELRTEQDKSEATNKLRKALSMLDKAAGAGIIHKRNADRNKSRLTILVNKLG